MDGERGELLPEQSNMEPDEPTIKRLGPWELDALAAHAGRSLAPVFALNDWTWARSPKPPDAALIAVKVREQLADVEMDHSLTSGRITVSKWIEDDEENATVTLQVGDIWPQKGSCS